MGFTHPHLGRARRLLPAVCCALIQAPLGRAQNCARTSTGLVPLSDLRAGSYKTYAGGLYPGRSNRDAGRHRVAMLNFARRITPFDGLGRPSPNGKIVLLSIGMSNTTMEFQAFQALAAKDPKRAPALVLVDGAQGGWDAVKIANPNATFWTVVGRRLTRAGVTAAQVRAVWLKEAIARPTQGFPAEARRLQGLLETIVQILKSRFPNLDLCFLSSRIYAGYATTSLNPEPYAYESAFAVRWLVADQVAGKASLNYDPGRGAVKAPLLVFGPYLWADGTKGRSDGLKWYCTDFGRDGTHPSSAGRTKVAQLLLSFFETHPAARPWFTKEPPRVAKVPAAAMLFGGGTSGTIKTPPEIAPSILPRIPGPEPFALLLDGCPPKAALAVVLGFQRISLPFAGGRLYTPPALALAGAAGAYGHAKIPVGTLPGLPPLSGLATYWQGLVADPRGNSGLVLTAGLEARLGY